MWQDNMRLRIFSWFLHPYTWAWVGGQFWANAKQKVHFNSNSNWGPTIVPWLVLEMPPYPYAPVCSAHLERKNWAILIATHNFFREGLWHCWHCWHMTATSQNADDLSTLFYNKKVLCPVWSNFERSLFGNFWYRTVGLLKTNNV